MELELIVFLDVLKGELVPVVGCAHKVTILMDAQLICTSFNCLSATALNPVEHLLSLPCHVAIVTFTEPFSWLSGLTVFNNIYYMYIATPLSDKVVTKVTVGGT